MSFDQSELLVKSPLGVLVCDKQQRITWCNDRFLTDTGLIREQVIDQLYPALPLEAIDKNTQLVQLFNENGGEDVKFQYWQEELDSPAEHSVHYFTRERLNKDKVSMAAAKLAGAKLAKRNNWVEFLDYEVSRSRRYDNPLSIIKLHLLVLDKPDNVVEETLQQTVKDTLTDELRWADMIGHTDHGSFLAVLPETPESALKSLQEKLSQALKRQLDFVSDALKYEIVFGEACWRKHDDSRQLLKRARSQLVEKLEALLP